MCSPFFVLDNFLSNAYTCEEQAWGTHKQPQSFRFAMSSLDRVHQKARCWEISRSSLNRCSTREEAEVALAEFWYISGRCFSYLFIIRPLARLV